MPVSSVKLERKNHPHTTPKAHERQNLLQNVSEEKTMSSAEDLNPKQKCSGPIRLNLRQTPLHLSLSKGDRDTSCVQLPKNLLTHLPLTSFRQLPSLRESI